MNLYEQLGIEQTASPQEVKKAYFRLVRQFTPEKDPKVFMRTRQAYETLSDEAKRTAYDVSLSRFIDVPEEVTAVIMEAELLGTKRLWVDAVCLLEQSEHFTHNEMQCALCRLYLDMEKSGKAVKIIENLIAHNPDDTVYLRLASKAYMARGWTNKAHDIRENLERIDPGNEDNEPALLFGETNQHPFLMGRAVEKIEEKGRKAPLLCAHILSNCLWLKHSDMDYIRQRLLFELMDKKDINPWEDSLFAAKKLAEHTEDISNDKREQVSILLKTSVLEGMFQEDCYSILPHVDQTIKNIGAEEIFQSPGYDVVSLGYTALKTVQAGIPKTLAALPLMRVWSQIDILDEKYKSDYQNEILVLEMDVLGNSRFFIPHIRRFRDEFNLSYQHAADFFDMILQSGDHKIQNEIRRRIPMAMKLDSRLTLSWLGENDYIVDIIPEERKEPIRVTKFGRNEPCPCGSGKKYKKCCGARF